VQVRHTAFPATSPPLPGRCCGALQLRHARLSSPALRQLLCRSSCAGELQPGGSGGGPFWSAHPGWGAESGPSSAQAVICRNTATDIRLPSGSLSSPVSRQWRRTSSAW
jgi:hypothetical protein